RRAVAAGESAVGLTRRRALVSRIGRPFGQRDMQGHLTTFAEDDNANRLVDGRQTDAVNEMTFILDVDPVEIEDNVVDAKAGQARGRLGIDMHHPGAAEPVEPETRRG